MVTRIKPKQSALVVVFERDGEEPVRVEATHGKNAMSKAVTLLLALSKLHVGDRLTVEAAD